MSKFFKMALIGTALFSLSGCMSEGIDSDSSEGMYEITHTTRGTLYWE